MNAITAYFNEYTKKNPQIIEAYSKGLLTVQEATKSIFKAIQTEETTAAVIEILKSYGYTARNKTIEETAAAFVSWYGEEAPAEVNKIFESK